MKMQRYLPRHEYAHPSCRCTFYSTKKWLLSLAFSLLSFAAFAQSGFTVRGTVTDQQGTALSGVTVSRKGTPAGSITDTDGKYQVNVTDGKSTLVFTHVGYITAQVPVNGRPVINMTLAASHDTLGAVVVVAYGTQQKKTLTGSVASITAEQLNTSTQTNMLNMMTGKLPGLRVIQRNSEPGSYRSSFDIRGFGAPLVVVDGVPRNNFNRIDPNEIESISIIKDASAAVYGLKAANGVVLITTKKGKAGKVEFNYSGSYGIANVTNSPVPLSAYQYGVLTNEAFYNTGYNGNRPGPVPGTPPFSSEQLEDFRSGKTPGTNWLGVGMRQSAPVAQHNLSITGGTDKVRYYVSFGYMDEQGFWESGDLNYKRFNFRSNIIARLTKNLEVEVLLGGYYDIKKEPGTATTDVYKSMWMQVPTIPVYANNNPDYLSNVPGAWHPLASTDAGISGYRHYKNRSFQGTVALNYTVPFVEGLKARAMFSYDPSYATSKQWLKKYGLYDYDAANDTYTATYANNPSSLYQSFSESINAQVQLSLNYKHTFRQDHNLEVLALFEQIQRNVGVDNFNGRREFSLDAVDQLYAGNALNQTVNSGNITPLATQSVAGRLNYDYQGKYLLEGSFSMMGSSKFAEGSRWGFFPGIQGGWRISEENFLKNRFSFLDNLKLRVSWGKMGDEEAINFQHLTGYNYPGNSYILGNTVIAGLGFRGLPNLNLTWFDAITTNYGVDADLWKGLLHVELDYFTRKRTKLLATRNLSLPASVGASLPQENLNSDFTRGLEVLLSHTNQAGQFNYRVSANMSMTRTKALYVERAVPASTDNHWRTNGNERWNDIYWGYKYIGQFTSFEEIYKSPVQDGEGNRTLLPGDLKYLDYSGDGIIDGSDIHPIGRTNSVPQTNFGLSFDVSWKNIDVNILLQGGTNFYVNYVEQLQAPLQWDRSGLAYFFDRWHQQDPTNPESPWIPGKYPSTRRVGTHRSNYLPSDFWRQDATYLRLRSAEIGYSIPPHILERAGIKRLRVYANTFNPLTWTKVKFIDPEHTQDTWGYEYPITRNFNFGLNLTF